MKLKSKINYGNMPSLSILTRIIYKRAVTKITQKRTLTFFAVVYVLVIVM